MKPEDVTIPDRLKDFPFYRGKYLVHYTVYVGEADGIPDFKVVHEENRRKCLKENLCHLCGQGLTRLMVLIGGPKSVENRMFMDGPMHEECAKYAAQVCPYLAMTEHGHSKAPPKHRNDPGIQIVTHEEVTAGRPNKMALYYTNGYDYGWVEQMQAVLVRAWAPLKIDWDFMPQKESG